MTYYGNYKRRLLKQQTQYGTFRISDGSNSICSTHMSFFVDTVDVVAVDRDIQENQLDGHIMRPGNAINVKFGIRHERYTIIGQNVAQSIQYTHTHISKYMSILCIYRVIFGQKHHFSGYGGSIWH